MSNVNGHFWHLGLIGWPLGHSLSPRLHSAALAAAGLRGEYALYPLPLLPEGQATWDDFFARFRRGEWDGVNVTIPHKQTVLAYLEELTPAAQAIGAVNTILRRDGALVGENTDAVGFEVDLQRTLGGGAALPAGRALVLGAGGAARAAVYALAQMGWQVHLAARRQEQAAALAAQLSAAGTITAGELSFLGLQVLAADADLLVNATPVGMTPHVEGCPWPTGLPFPAHARVYDLIYSPAETIFLHRARLAGLQVANGLGMLVEQAAQAFERWIGCAADRAAMFRALQLNPAEPW